MRTCRAYSLWHYWLEGVPRCGHLLRQVRDKVSYFVYGIFHVHLLFQHTRNYHENCHQLWCISYLSTVSDVFSSLSRCAIALPKHQRHYGYGLVGPTSERCTLAHLTTIPLTFQYPLILLTVHVCDQSTYRPKPSFPYTCSAPEAVHIRLSHIYLLCVWTWGSEGFFRKEKFLREQSIKTLTWGLKCWKLLKVQCFNIFKNYKVILAVSQPFIIKN